MYVTLQILDLLAIYICIFVHFTVNWFFEEWPVVLLIKWRHNAYLIYCISLTLVIFYKKNLYGTKMMLACRCAVKKLSTVAIDTMHLWYIVYLFARRRRISCCRQMQKVCRKSSEGYHNERLEIALSNHNLFIINFLTQIMCGPLCISEN